MHLLWPNMGEMPGRDNISAVQVNSALGPGTSAGSRFAGYVQHFDTIESTNRTALQAAQQGARCGVWVADEQTAGRGRGGHTWHSAAGEGLYVSALIAPRLPVQQAMWISLAAGLAAQQAIEESCDVHVDLRWPNDLVVGQAAEGPAPVRQNKCGGILVETSGEASGSAQTSWLRYAVIGIGINVNQGEFPPGFATAATSLRRERGVSLLRQPLLIHLLRALDHQILLLEQEAEGHSQVPGLRERFAEASTWVRGRHVQVPEQGGYTGVTAGLDARGFLLVDGDDGRQHTVLSGGVRDLE